MPMMARITTMPMPIRVLRDTADSPSVPMARLWQRRADCSTAPAGQAFEGGFARVRTPVFVHRIVVLGRSSGLGRLRPKRRLAERALHEFHLGDSRPAQIGIDSLRQMPGVMAQEQGGARLGQKGKDSGFFLEAH